MIFKYGRNDNMNKYVKNFEKILKKLLLNMVQKLKSV